MITSEELRHIMPGAKRIDEFLPQINTTIERFAINTPAREAAFIAQIAHESGQFQWTRELWGPTPAQSKYEGRVDLGNFIPGDGEKFKGRGLIQITGRANYKACGDFLGYDFTAHPELLEESEMATLSSGWFWTEYKKLNSLADIGAFDAITKHINGGQNGRAERWVFFRRAMEILV